VQVCRGLSECIQEWRLPNPVPHTPRMTIDKLG
jgi:hypothetical protein